MGDSSHMMEVVQRLARIETKIEDQNEQIVDSLKRHQIEIDANKAKTAKLEKYLVGVAIVVLLVVLGVDPETITALLSQGLFGSA